MLTIADHQFESRLFTGTGKFAQPETMLAAIKASQSQLVTLAVKQLDLSTGSDNILQPLLDSGVKLLPNTAGARNVKEAIFAAHLAREMLGTNWLKLEIHPDPKYLMPDPIETLKQREFYVSKAMWCCLMYMPILCCVAALKKSAAQR